MIVMDRIKQIATKLLNEANDQHMSRVVCIQCDKQQVMERDGKLLIKGSVLELL